MRAVTKDAVVHGHSTPRIAGLFAKQVNANRLIMNHFSARYRGDATLESIATMTRIEEQALKASGLSQDRVAAAWDVSH
jgi:ribonuclease Z